MTISLDRSYDGAFVEQVEEITGGDFHRCMQCGTCSGSCPMDQFMKLSPRKAVLFAHFGLKEKVLEPFLANENFRQGIKDYGEEAFKSQDRRIREDVTFLISNLEKRYRYTPKGAKEVCIYVIDNDLARRYGTT